MQVGGVVVALCGISMSNKLLEELMHHKPVQPLYLMPDNDTAGQNTTKKLAARLQNPHIPFVIAPLDAAYNRRFLTFGCICLSRMPICGERIGWGRFLCPA